MVSGRHKSRTYRRIPKKTPGSRQITQYKKRKPGLPKCAMCKTALKGTLRERKQGMKVAKSKKVPNRKYGGNLCSKCSRKAIVAEERK